MNNPTMAAKATIIQSGIAVDREGTLALCWYDRRESEQNLAIERWCATSENQGKIWEEQKIPVAAFAPAISQDLEIQPDYLGDYDGLATDFLKTEPGFMGAFEIMHSRVNPDVVFTRLRSR